MKITIFGLTISSSWGNGHATPYRALIRALHRLGHQVTFFEKDAEYYARRRDFSSCEYCKLVLYDEWRTVRTQALRAAADSDLVMTASFLPDGAQINDELLELDSPQHVFYDLDTPVTLKRLEASAKNALEYLRADQIGRFDLYLSFTGGGILGELRERWGAQRVGTLYGCVDPDVHYRIEVPPQYCCDLSYMGTYSADRQDKVDELFVGPATALPDERFILAGSMYPRHWDWPKNVQRFEHVGPQDHAALYSGSKVTLNITRTEMAKYGYCPSGRMFEAAACSTPLISDWWKGIEDFFIDGKEFLLVHSRQEVVSVLKLPEAELQKMAMRARERTLDEHTGMQRARELLLAIERTSYLPMQSGFIAEAA